MPDHRGTCRVDVCVCACSALCSLLRLLRDALQTPGSRDGRQEQSGLRIARGQQVVHAALGCARCAPAGRERRVCTRGKSRTRPTWPQTWSKPGQASVGRGIVWPGVDRLGAKLGSVRPNLALGRPRPTSGDVRHRPTSARNSPKLAHGRPIDGEFHQAWLEIEECWTSSKKLAHVWPKSADRFEPVICKIWLGGGQFGGSLTNLGQSRPRPNSARVTPKLAKRRPTWRDQGQS